MYGNKKYSLRSSFKTGPSSTCNSDRHECAHSWKCYINPNVNYQYHELMLERQGRKRIKNEEIKKRPYSQNHRISKEIPNFNYVDPIFPVTQRPIQRNKRIQAEKIFYQPVKQTNSVGIQTKEMVVVQPSQYIMKNQERKYLRDKFIDHYGILHNRKFG